MTYDFNHGMPEEPQYKDETDYLGSSDASLEMGVIAVAAMGVTYWFFSWLFPWVVTASLGFLAYRVFRGKTTAQALWARIKALPGKVRERIARTKVRLIVEMVPDEVSDAETVYNWCFPTPYKVQDQETYRRWFVARVFERMPRKSDTIGATAGEVTDAARTAMSFVDVLTMLADYGDDPLNRMLQATVRRKMAPPTAPKALPPKMQGIGAIGAVTGGFFTPITMWAAAIIVTLFSLNMWAWSEKGKAEDERDEAMKSARMWQDAHQQTYDNAVLQAQRRDRETKAALEEAEKSRALAATAQGRAARLAAREKRQNEQAIDGVPADLDQRLRERLAEPAAAAEPPATGADSDRPAG
jgi:hypothetical protein